MNDAGIDPAVIRRNRILGLILAGVVILITTGFMIQFTRKGLPQDPDVFRRISREGRAGQPLGEGSQTSTIPPKPASPAGEDSTP